MSQPDGGPAFPGQPRDPHGEFIDEYRPGITLRDYFAIRALVGDLMKAAPGAPRTASYREVFARRAYRMADAMMAAREEGR